jgi:hypothetical protein
LVTVANFANGLWRQWDNRGNPWRTDTSGQLRKCHGSEDDSHLLHARRSITFAVPSGLWM